MREDRIRAHGLMTIDKTIHLPLEFDAELVWSSPRANRWARFTVVGGRGGLTIENVESSTPRQSLKEWMTLASVDAARVHIGDSLVRLPDMSREEDGRRIKSICYRQRPPAYFEAIQDALLQSDDLHWEMCEELRRRSAAGDEAARRKLSNETGRNHPPIDYDAIRAIMGNPDADPASVRAEVREARRTFACPSTSRDLSGLSDLELEEQFDEAEAIYLALLEERFARGSEASTGDR
jgi:hypothetical protein